MKLAIYVLALALIAAGTAAAGEEFAEAQSLIEQNIGCSELTDTQLEIIGDYYMEQMHPGELHKIMDERMGGEGSESLRLIHIRIAESFNCGQSEQLPAGMMNTLMGRGPQSMMGQGYSGSSFGMMGYANSSLFAFQLFSIFMWIIIIAGAAFLLWWMIKLAERRNISGKK